MQALVGPLKHIIRLLKRIAKILFHTEKMEMANFAKLNDDIAALAAKVDARSASDVAKDARIADLEAQLAAVVQPVDEQPAVDAADVAVQAIIAKIP